MLGKVIFMKNIMLTRLGAVRYGMAKFCQARLGNSYNITLIGSCFVWCGLALSCTVWYV